MNYPGGLRIKQLLAICLLLSACSEPATPLAQKQATAPLALETLVVDTVRVPKETRFDGMVEALNQASVAAQTGGRVLELLYDVGDYVEQDAVIARLTGVEQRARSESADASLDETRARLSEAQSAYERTKEIYARKLIAKSQLDTASADLASARARAEAAQAAVKEARQGVNYTVIRAPYPGIVMARHVQVGETVSTGQLLMTGVSLEQLRVAVQIPQHHMETLRTYRKARVLLPNGLSLDAEAIRIPPNADSATQTFRVLVTLPAGDYGVFPGTLVKVVFISGESDRLLLPEHALVRRGEVTGVYVISDDTIDFRYISTGTATADGRVPVLAGLTAGEHIAVDPAAATLAYRRRPVRQEVSGQ